MMNEIKRSNRNCAMTASHRPMASDVEKAGLLADIDTMHDVYMSRAQREAYDRIKAAALTQPAASGEVAQPDADTVRDALLQIRHSIQQARKPGNDWRRELKLIENITDAAIDAAITGEKP